MAIGDGVAEEQEVEERMSEPPPTQTLSIASMWIATVFMCASCGVSPAA